MSYIAKAFESASLAAGMVGPSGIQKGKAVGSALELWLRTCQVKCLGVGVLGPGVGTLPLMGNRGAVASFGLKKEWREAVENGAFLAPYTVTGPVGVGLGTCSVTGFVGEQTVLENLIKAEYAKFGMKAGDEVKAVAGALYSGFMSSTGTGAISGGPIIPPGASGALPFFGTFIF